MTYASFTARFPSKDSPDQFPTNGAIPSLDAPPFVLLPESTEHPDVTAYVSAVNTAGGSLSDGERSAFNTFVQGLYIDGLRNSSGSNHKVTWLWIPFGGSFNAFRCSLYHPSSIGTQVTLTNFVLADLSNANGADPGVSNTNKYGDSGIRASANFTEDNTHLMFWSNRDVTNAGSDVGARGGSTTNWAIVSRNTDGSTYMPAYNNPADAPNFAVADSLGMFVVSRTAINILKGYQNGTLGTTNTTTRTSSLPFQNVLTHWVQGFGTYSSRVCWAAGAGRGLTDTDVSNYYNRLNTLLTTIRV